MTRVFKLGEVCYVAFFTYRSPFSNFFATKFVCPDENGFQQSYSSSEQLYFHSKALFYGESDLAKRIMSEQRPNLIKQIGREIEVDERWDDKSKDVMERALYHKFTQNDKLLRLLLSTYDAELVEASPHDQKWGIGIAMNDPRFLNKSNWRGENRLGTILMIVRSRIMEESRFAQQVEIALADRETWVLEDIISSFPNLPFIRSPEAARANPVCPTRVSIESTSPSLPLDTVESALPTKSMTTVVLDDSMSERPPVRIQDRLAERMLSMKKYYTQGSTLNVGKLLYMYASSQSDKSSLLHALYREYSLVPSLSEEKKLKKSLNRRVEALLSEERGLKRRKIGAESLFERLLNPSFINIHPNELSCSTKESPNVHPMSSTTVSPSKYVAECPEGLLAYSSVNDAPLVSHSPPRKAKQITAKKNICPSPKFISKTHVSPSSPPPSRSTLSHYNLSPTPCDYSPPPRNSIPNHILPRHHHSSRALFHVDSPSSPNLPSTSKGKKVSHRSLNTLPQYSVTISPQKYPLDTCAPSLSRCHVPNANASISTVRPSRSLSPNVDDIHTSLVSVNSSPSMSPTRKKMRTAHTVTQKPISLTIAPNTVCASLEVVHHDHNYSSVTPGTTVGISRSPSPNDFSPLHGSLTSSPIRKKMRTAHTVMLPSGTTIRSRREMSGTFNSSFDPGPSQFSHILPRDPPTSTLSLLRAKQWIGTGRDRDYPLPKNVKQNLSRAIVRREVYKNESSYLRKENKSLLRDQYRLETENAEKDEVIAVQSEALSNATAELRESRKVSAEQEAQIDDLRNQLHAKESSEKDLKRGRHYTPDTHVTVLKLKEIGIADANIGKAMQIVSGELFQTALKSTPSATTVGRMSYEMNALANKNTAMKLSKLVKDKKCMSIGSDETTKLYHKLQAYQIWYEDDNGKRRVHNLAMKPVISKSAEVSLNTVLQILDRIDKSSSEQSSELSHSLRDLVIAQTHSAIGDRATTQTRFAELFEQYRVEILPKVMEEWASMSDDERTAHQTFLSLPCQLHVIASAISPAMIALAKHEEEITGATGLKEETSSVNLALKLFTHTFGSRSSAKYGTFRIFRAWCKKKKIPCISLPALNGNRFNIIPTIAARIFLNRATYAEFLSEVNIESKKSLLEALSNEIVMKHIQSLGFIDQYVTGPLWRILNSDINTLDAHKYITAFDEWMVQRVSNPSLIFTVASPKIGLPIPEKTFKFSGTIMKELLSVPTCPMIERAVSLTMSAIREFIAKVLAPFTTGGLIHSISTTNTVVNNAMKGMIGCAPLTNMGCESVFGYADYLINKAPRKRISRVEGELLCKRNNVLEWLDSMGAVERDQIIRECIRESRHLEREAREECEQLNNAILEIETKKAELNEARKIRVCALDKELTNYLMSYGFFQSKEDIDTFLQNESDIQNQVTVLVKQLRYRQKILKQEPKGKKFFTVTEGKKPLTVAQLRCKLVNAIECDPLLNQTQIGDVSISTIRNKSFVQHGKDDSFTFNVTDCRKAWHRGPSYLLLKYDHRPFTTAMTYDYFSDLLDKKIFESV